MKTTITDPSHRPYLLRDKANILTGSYRDNLDKHCKPVPGEIRIILRARIVTAGVEYRDPLPIGVSVSYCSPFGFWDY